ncbi:MAG: DUF2007 domain-containing protein [Anaerolineales bacterium]|jgi:hypothetical protein|nr:DUF2007 domain-containing protein [Anaerolineales bacterium]
MNQEEWVLIDTTAGQLQAEIVRGMLEAQGIQVWLNQAGAAHAYAMTVGSMGRVEVLVPSSASEQAQRILSDYYAGTLEDMGLQGIEDVQPVDDKELADEEDE